MKGKMVLLMIFLISSVVLASGCINTQKTEIPNPAAKYCDEQGLEYEIREAPSGDQYGVCILENETVCDAWAYYEGGCESCLTYCKKQPHIMCTGHWNITGEYPDCNCEWVCEEGGPV